VAISRTLPVSLLVTVIETPGITAPLASCAVPVREPTGACAKAKLAQAKTQIRKRWNMISLPEE
jgi:hypothetical protein